jgi:hypothetical protein
MIVQPEPADPNERPPWEGRASGSDRPVWSGRLFRVNPPVSIKPERLECDIDRMQRIEERIVVATGAPREAGCLPWVVLG